MVFTNGVNNLIWDFNPKDAATMSWTPGETYYDILSVDIYNAANDHQSNSSAFIDLTNKAGTNKIITLSENGPIPDVDKMYEDGATWSWWMPWYESWSGGFVSQTAASVWQKNLADERIITLDEMPGWDNYNEAAAATNACPTSTQNAKFGADTAKANSENVDLLMGVTYKAINDSGANIEFKKVPNLTGAKSIAVTIENKGSGGEMNGIWIGMAFVRDGSKDKAWTWEQSPSDGCWLNDGAKSTCEFAIETYTDDAGVEHPMDLDKLFSVTFILAGANGFEGTVLFDNMVTDNGIIINGFNKKTELFTAADQSKGHIASIELFNKDGTPVTPNAIKPIAAAKKAGMSVKNGNLSLTANASGFASIDVFNMIGKRIATLHRGNLSAGSHTFSLQNLNKGQYIIRVKGAGLNATQKVLIK